MAASVLLYADKVKGTMLGGICGDVLGAGVENLEAREIIQLHPNGVTDYLDTDRG